jgi:hypothetical protein
MAIAVNHAFHVVFLLHPALKPYIYTCMRGLDIMAGQYSVLNRKTTFLAVFFTAMLALIPLLHAQEDPYTVSGVRVDATAASAVDARKQAFEQAQQAAFSLLASRFLSQDQMKNFQAPPAAQITPLVDDFEITNEKLSPTRYVGTYTFRFRHGASQNLINARAGMAANAGGYGAASPVNSGNNAGAVDYNGVYNPNSAYNPAPAYNPDTAYRPATAAPAPQPGNTVKLRAHFTSIGEWTRTQKALRATPGVIALHTLSLSPADATVELRYQGTEAALRQSLGLAGLGLSQPAAAAAGTAGDQAYNPYAAAYNATAVASPAADTVYDLYVTPVPASPVLPIAAAPMAPITRATSMAPPPSAYR